MEKFTKDKIVCENCIHYKFIDSAYGYCYARPPQPVRKKWFSMNIEWEYPVVAWCQKICGTFINHAKSIKERE